MIKNPYKGITYQSLDSWECRSTRFIVVNVIALEYISGPKIKIKLLDIPDYKSIHCDKLGYGMIFLSSLRKCKIVESNQNIAEYIKDLLFE